MNPVRKLINMIKYNNLTIKKQSYFLAETLSVDFLNGMNISYLTIKNNNSTPFWSDSGLFTETQGVSCL